MSDISALSPSPPGMADQSVPGASSPHVLVSEKCIPKSSLYGDRSVMDNPTVQADGNTSTRETTSGPTSALGPSADGGTVGQNDLNGKAEAYNEEQTSEPERQMSPSSDLNPIPNLYPNIQVSQIPSTASHMDTPEVCPLPDLVCSEPLHTYRPTLSQDSNQTVRPPSETHSDPKSSHPSTPSKSAMVSEGPASPEPPVLLVQESPGSLGLPGTRPALDTLSYLESASLMSGTLESLTGLGEDGSSVGSDSEINGPLRRTDKYGFLGGAQYCEGSEVEIAVAVARQREMKWLDMFKNWDKWISRRFQKVKIRCRKGIPSSLRARAWQLLSNSQELLQANPGKFDELEQEQGDPKWLDIIEKDLHRQFPFHEMFAARGGHGQQDLYRILKAYTIYRPDEGYCQAQAPVAAVLLMHMPAEQAFWCLVQICERYLPGYYSAGLEAIQLDGEIFFSLLRRVCPMAYRHLKKFKIDPILYMTEWFMCIFSRTLPWASVLRVWDMFFCEGVKIVFRVGLVLLKQILGSVDKLRELQGMYETMERLRNISPESIKEDVLVQEVVTLSVTEALIERECTVQVRKWRESRGDLTHQPKRRLHGTRAIYEQKHRAAAINSGGSLSFLGAPVPPPGPLRASSSLLSLPGLRKSKMTFTSQNKKGQDEGRAAASSQLNSKPPVAPHKPSPLAASSSSAKPQKLLPAPLVVSEHVTPTIPSPTANNAPLPPLTDATKSAAAVAGEDDGKKKRKSKEDKKKVKEEEKLKSREKKEKERCEKERLRREKDRAEREKKKGGKKKEREAEKNGAAAAKDSA